MQGTVIQVAWAQSDYQSYNVRLHYTLDQDGLGSAH